MDAPLRKNENAIEILKLERWGTDRSSFGFSENARRCGRRTYGLGTLFWFVRSHVALDVVLRDVNEDRVHITASPDKGILFILGPKNEICMLVDVKDEKPDTITRT